jgi:hypothetical protein
MANAENKTTTSKYPKRAECSSQREAIKAASKWVDAIAITMEGKSYIVHQDYIDALNAGGAEFAYLCDHEGRIVTVPAK